MYGNLGVTAVVVAAGRGSRMKTCVKKQYLMLGDKPVLARTLQVFENCSVVDSVVLVVPRGEVKYCEENIVDRYSYSKVRKVLPGGDTCQRSVAEGLDAVKDEIVVIHDGVRPLFDCYLVEEGIRLLVEGGYHGTACAVPVKDTVKIVDKEEIVQETLNREQLRAVQTPQCFYYEVINRVYEKACKEGIESTDDSGLLEYYGYKIKLYPGSYRNIKITTPEDILLARVLMGGVVSNV